MNIYAKLAKARIDLQSINISKSGLNTYSHFKYFELQDIIPHINKVMHDNGLCGVVSFEHTNAFLTIYASEGEGSIVFQSPIADATVKGATPIQCLGSMHTYLRRYLWMLALEIVEHDAIDSQQSEPENKHEQAIKSAKSLQELVTVWQTIPKALQKQLTPVKDDMKAKLTPKQEAA
jgi:hypothetical protein